MKLERHYEIGDIVNNCKIIRTIGDPFLLTREGKQAVFPGHRGHAWVTYELECLRCHRLTHRREDMLASVSCKGGPCSKKFIDISGKRFGKLVALRVEKQETVKSRFWRWLCQCDCGKMVTQDVSQILRGSQRCPDCARKFVGEQITLPNQMSAWRRHIRLTRRNARDAGRPFTLTERDVVRICTQPCAYCGQLPCRDSLGLVRNGIDRVDNSKGYTLDNVVTACTTCNIMKQDLSHVAFIDHIKRILNRIECSTTIPTGSTPKQVETERYHSEWTEPLGDI